MFDGSRLGSNFGGRPQQAARGPKLARGEVPKPAAESLRERSAMQKIEKRVTDAEHITARMQACVEASTACIESKHDSMSSRQAEAKLRKLSETLEALKSKALEQIGSSEHALPLNSCASMQSTLDLIAKRDERLQQLLATTRVRNLQKSENRKFAAERKLTEASHLQSEHLQKIRDYEERLAAIEHSREETTEEFEKAKAVADQRKADHYAARLRAFPEHLQKYMTRDREETIASEVIEARRAEASSIKAVKDAAQHKESELNIMMAQELQECHECKHLAEEQLARIEERARNEKDEIRRDSEAQTAMLMQQLVNAENAMHQSSDAVQVELSQRLEALESRTAEVEQSEKEEVQRFREEEDTLSIKFESEFTEAEHVINEMKSRTALTQNEIQLAKEALADAQKEAMAEKERRLELCEAEITARKHNMDQELECAEIEIASIRGEIECQERLADTANISEMASIENKTEELVAVALASMKRENAELDVAQERYAEHEERANLMESVAYELATSIKMDACAPLRSLEEQSESVRQRQATTLDEMRHDENRLLSRIAQGISSINCTLTDKVESIEFGRESIIESAEAEIRRFDIRAMNEKAASSEMEEQFEFWENTLEAFESTFRSQQQQLALDRSEKLAALDSEEMSIVKQLEALRDEAKDEEAGLQLEEYQCIENADLDIQEHREAGEEAMQLAEEEMANAYESERDCKEEVQEKSHYLNLWQIDEVDAADVEAQRQVTYAMEDFNARMEEFSELVRSERAEQEIQIRSTRAYKEERQEVCQAEHASSLEVGSRSRAAEELLRKSREVHEEQEEAARLNEERIATIRAMEETEVALKQREIDCENEVAEEARRDFEIRSERAEERQEVAKALQEQTEAKLKADLERLEAERRERGEAADARYERATRAMNEYFKRTREGETRALTAMERNLASRQAASPGTSSKSPLGKSVPIPTGSSSMPGWGGLSDPSKRSRYRASRELRAAQNAAETDHVAS